MRVSLCSDSRTIDLSLSVSWNSAKSISSLFKNHSLFSSLVGSSLPLIDMSSSVCDPLSSDDDSTFEHIDTNLSSSDVTVVLVNAMEKQSLREEKLEEETIDKVAPKIVEQELREMIATKDEEIDRVSRRNEENEERLTEMRRSHDEEKELLIRTIEEQKKEIETLKTLSGMRTITFRKIDGRFGAGHNGTSISSIVKGGPADRAGLLKGDQLISINGVNVETMANDMITKLSVDVSDDVTLVVRFNPERLKELK